MCEQGKAGPLIVFAEGGTTNGNYITQFKKGAFASLKAVKPVLQKNWCMRGSIARGDLMGFWQWTFLVPFNTIVHIPEIVELPVFEPNEFFWNKYWDGKNEDDKWKVYARAVQEMYSEVGGLKMSDSVQEDKEAYKKLVWGDKFKED